MKKIILICMLFLGFSVGWCSQQQNTIKEMKEEFSINYENKQYKFSLDIPDTRTFKENIYGAAVMFFAPHEKSDTIKENLGITIQTAWSGTDLGQLYQKNKETITNIADKVTIDEEKDITINNLPAKEIAYSFIQGQYAIKQEQILLMKWNNEYIMTYVALQNTFDEYKWDVDKIISTLTIK